MLIGRFKNKINKNIFFGIVNGDTVTPVQSLFYPRKTGSDINLNELEVLCPVNPSKILAIGKNYKDHVKEFDGEVPKSPIVFAKANNSLIGPNENICFDSSLGRVDYEGEIVVVIKKECHKVSEKDSMDYVLGFTCGNDISARHLQKSDGQWTRAKGADTFCPIGPFILPAEEESDFNELTVRTYLNEKKVQEDKASSMIFNIPFLISYISQTMTLFPGDIILTGTPSGVGALKDKDIVEIEIDGIGKLRNTALILG